MLKESRMLQRGDTTAGAYCIRSTIRKLLMNMRGEGERTGPSRASLGVTKEEKSKH